MSNQKDGFNSNTQQFAEAISRVIPAEDISTATENTSVHAPRILQALRQDMPKEEQRKFRDMFCGSAPRSNASDRVLLSAIRESISFLGRQSEGEASK